MRHLVHGALLGVLLGAGPAFADVPGAVPLPIALFGRLHFPLLHFPIVLLFGVLFLEVAFRSRKGRHLVDDDKRREVATLLLAVTAVLSVMTTLAGLAYAQGEDFDGASAQTFWLHRAGGIAVAVAGVVLLVARRATGALSKLYAPLLVAAVVAVAATAHQGGSLVHGDGFYTRPLRDGADVPKGDRGDKGDKGDKGDDGPILSYDDGDGPDGARARHPEGTIPEKPDYALHIQPIFERSCVKCHGPEKRKSGLRLDEKRFAMKGGESGPVSIVPGDPDKSMVYTWCGKAPDDEDVMPPKGKLLALSEIETIKRWIEQGATWPE